MIWIVIYIWYFTFINQNDSNYMDEINKSKRGWVVPQRVGVGGIPEVGWCPRGWVASQMDGYPEGGCNSNRDVPDIRIIWYNPKKIPYPYNTSYNTQYNTPDMGYYPLSGIRIGPKNQVSFWILYLVHNDIQYFPISFFFPISSIFRYPFFPISSIFQYPVTCIW